jgi:hypothetical protein
MGGLQVLHIIERDEAYKCILVYAASGGIPERAAWMLALTPSSAHKQRVYWCVISVLITTDLTHYRHPNQEVHSIALAQGKV